MTKLLRIPRRARTFGPRSGGLGPCRAPVSVSTVGGAEEEDLMRRQPWGLYAIALPIIAGGLVVLGVPVLALLFAAFVLACPFIMVFVMSVMRVGNGIHDG